MPPSSSRVDPPTSRPRWRWTSWRSLAACGAATASVAACAFAIAVSSPACLTRACDMSQEVFGLKDGEGRLVDDDTWESSPIDGKWLPYPHQRTWVIFYGGYMKGRTPKSIDVYLAADERPNQAGSNFTVGGGDVVKMYNVTADSMGLVNGTCADYFVRVVVHAPKAAPPAPTDAAPTDGGDSGGAPDGQVDAWAADASDGGGD